MPARDVTLRDVPSRSVSAVPSALSHWTDVTSILAEGVPIVFLDFDGTLSPLVDEPDAAVLAPGMAAAIDGVASRWTVAVISGRGADDVRARVDRDDIWVAGSHGFEIVAPDGARHDHPAAETCRAELEAAADALYATIGEVPGVLIERKHLGLTVHDRMVADADLDRVRQAADAEAARRPRVRATHGKRVTELRPDVAWDKGRAVQWMLDELAPADDRPMVPIYLGDDTTDEDAFRAIGDRGVTIVVAAGGDATRPTAATWTVADTDQVREVLVRLASLPLPHDPEHPSHVE